MIPASKQSTDLIAQAQADPLRPRYHFTSPAAWLNDPNGVAQWDGLYHLFYQYNPEGPFHDRIHWGHAVSEDLVRWRDRPIALSPGSGPDREGCWSGVLVDDGGTPTIVYSGRADGRELPCLAVGSANLDVWTPLDRPVIDAPPEGLEVTEFRDHCVWREAGRWRQLIGSGIVGAGGTALLYESEDLRSWTEVGPLVVGDGQPVRLDDIDWTGTMWECVDFFRLAPGPDGETGPPDADSADPHLLVFSAWHENITLRPFIAVGSYDGRRFSIDRVQRLDLGGRHAYAPQTFRDDHGRRVLWSWMQEGRDDAAQATAGWSGAMTIPRRLWLDADGGDAAGVVRAEPVAEVESLRSLPLLPLPAPTGQREFAGTAADVEIAARIETGDRLDVVLFATEDGAEHTDLRVHRRAGGVLEIVLDRESSTLAGGCDTSPHAGEVRSTAVETQIRILLDASSVEVFVDGTALTSRVYPTRPDASRIRIESRGGATVTSARAWRLEGTEQPGRVLRP
ncbi:glycoside hydrolase family 32 protein [Zhihengliuella alba]|uniref:beta-fructofuranosidase n=1 Tax=Zhihengliuella alba TaxID=547018 RepID=A0ABP7DQX7_9MICC